MYISLYIHYLTTANLFWILCDNKIKLIRLTCDQINIAVFFWYLVKNDASVRYLPVVYILDLRTYNTRFLHWKSHALQGTNNTVMFNWSPCNCSIPNSSFINELFSADLADQLSPGGPRGAHHSAALRHNIASLLPGVRAHSMMSPPMSPAKHKKAVDPDKPKRPMNGFMLFAKKFRLELIQAHPGKDNRYTYTTRYEINMAVFFWYLVKSDFSCVGYCTRVQWTSHFLQDTRYTRPCINGHPVG